MDDEVIIQNQNETEITPITAGEEIPPVEQEGAIDTGLHYEDHNGSTNEGEGGAGDLREPDGGVSPTESAVVPEGGDSSDEVAEPSDSEDVDEGLPDIKTLGQIVVNCKKIMENMAKLWLVTAREYHISDTIMRKLSVYNDQYRTKPDPELSKEELKEFDHLNGLDHLTLEDAIAIFGSNHICIKPTIEETRETIKTVASTFFDYAVAKREYMTINSAYLKYVEEQEVGEAERLQKMIEAETDPEKKKTLEDALHHYNWLKHLGFLAEPLSEKHLERIKIGLVDPKKAEYWLRRSSEKLGQLKADPQFIPMLYHFEEKNLDQKYRKLNNCLMIHFMTICIAADMHSPRDDYRNMARCFFIGIHSLWRGLLSEKARETVMKNIVAFEDQLIDVIEENPEGESLFPSTFG